MLIYVACEFMQVKTDMRQRHLQVGRLEIVKMLFVFVNGRCFKKSMGWKWEAQTVTGGESWNCRLTRGRLDCPVAQTPSRFCTGIQLRMSRDRICAYIVAGARRHVGRPVQEAVCALCPVFSIRVFINFISYPHLLVSYIESLNPAVRLYP